MWKALLSKLRAAPRGCPRAAQMTPLHEPDAGHALLRAASLGDMATVHAWLKAGADLEVRNADGRTALMLAAQGGHAAVVQALAAAGADIDGRDARNWSALMIAAHEGQLSVVQALARAGAAPAR
jgi:ankyrin repeat protein